MHGLIALQRREPHWLLTDQDAKTYGGALANAMRHVPIGVTQKALDFSALIFCIINMETPRVMASARNARERRRNPNAEPRGPAQVFEFRPPNPPPPPQPSAASPPPQPEGMAAEGFTGDGIDGPIGGH